jgi:hypothetical protein
MKDQFLPQKSKNHEKMKNMKNPKNVKNSERGENIDLQYSVNESKHQLDLTEESTDQLFQISHLSDQSGVHLNTSDYQKAENKLTQTIEFNSKEYRDKKHELQNDKFSRLKNGDLEDEILENPKMRDEVFGKVMHQVKKF